MLESLVRAQACPQYIKSMKKFDKPVGVRGYISDLADRLNKEVHEVTRKEIAIDICGALDTSEQFYINLLIGDKFKMSRDNAEKYIQDNFILPNALLQINHNLRD